MKKKFLIIYIITIPLSFNCFSETGCGYWFRFNKFKLSIDFNEYALYDFPNENKRYIELYSIPLSEGEGELVEYPTSLEGKEIFKWFAYNRGSVQAPKIDQCLPDITDKDKCLLKNFKN